MKIANSWVVLAAFAVAGFGGFTTPVLAQAQGSSTYATADTPVFAEIIKTKLDTKNAKVGDPITAKVVSQVSLNGGGTIPKGAILEGKVSAVQSKAAGNGTASMTILFDQIQPEKKATPIAIHGVLVGVAPKPNLSDSSGGTNSLPTTPGSAKTSPTLEAQLGYSNGSSSGPQTIPMGSSVRDITLASATDKDSSGTLTSSKKDFKLDGGMRIAVQLAGNSGS